MTTVEAGELVHVEQPAQIPATTLYRALSI